MACRLQNGRRWILSKILKPSFHLRYMKHLFMFDGAHTITSSSNALSKDPRVRYVSDKFPFIFRTMKADLPEKFLFSAIIDYEKNNFGGLSSLFRRCTENGHDRDDPELWDLMLQYRVQSFKIKRYRGNEVIWALPAIKEDQTLGYWNELQSGMNIGFLFLREDLYNEELEQNYVQRDAHKRRVALLGMALIDFYNEHASQREYIHTFIDRRNTEKTVRILESKGYLHTEYARPTLDVLI